MVLLWTLFVWFAAAGPVEDGAATWAEGDLDGAIETWESAIADGARGSAELHLNLGVAHYRKGNLPRAIAHWRQARIVSPRDPDPGHNLAVARAELEGVLRPNDPLPSWLSLATVGEFGLLAIGLLLLASAGGWLARWRGWSGWPWVAVALLGMLLGVASVEGARQLQAHAGAIVVGGPLGLRPDPDMSAPPTRTLPPGTELAVDQEVGDFLLVVTSDGVAGFVPASSVALVGVTLRLPAEG